MRCINTGCKNNKCIIITKDLRKHLQDTLTLQDNPGVRVNKMSYFGRLACSGASTYDVQEPIDEIWLSCAWKFGMESQTNRISQIKLHSVIALIKWEA